MVGSTSKYYPTKDGYLVDSVRATKETRLNEKRADCLVEEELDWLVEPPKFDGVNEEVIENEVDGEVIEPAEDDDIEDDIEDEVEGVTQVDQAPQATPIVVPPTNDRPIPRPNINSCEPEEAYHSDYDEAPEEEVVPDNDGPDDDLEEQIKRVLRSTDEFKDFVKNSSRVYEEEELNKWNTDTTILTECWVGQEWATYLHCKDYIRDQQIFQNYDIKKLKNTKLKQSYECVTFQCKSGYFEHTCDTTHGIINPMARARWVFRMMLEKFKAHPDYKPKHFQAEIKSAHGVEISYMTAWHARQKGLKAGVEANFSDVNHYHRYCFRHIWKNMKKYHPGQHFEKNMERIGEAKEAARLYLEKEEVEHWARSFFDYSSKCEHITSNFSEAFNSWILDIRGMPVC
ncbi:hypothetical protein MKW94_023497, partial [Papaver nudicaule]|nr:hypothetical protein [Papaver nudicaule]